MGRSRKAGDVMAKVKLTPAQRECLSVMASTAGMRASGSYAPTRKLVSLGLATKTDSEWWGNPLFTITPAGRVALTEGEKS